MELIYWYAAIALLVACMASVDLVRPVLNARNIPLDTKVIFYIVNFILAFLVAPVIIYPCISKLKGIEFRDSLDKAMFS